MEKLMSELWSCLPSKEDEAKTINHRIVQHFQSGLSTEELDVSLHTFFSEEKGIPSFLNAVANSSLKKIAAEIFCIFSYLLEWHAKSLDNYVTTMKNVCLSVIKRDSSSSDEKDKALDVLIALFSRGLWSSDLDIPSIISQLQIMASFRVTKPTVLRKVYSLVGVLAELFPLYYSQSSNRLLCAVLADLDHQITSSSKVEFLIIEGCFDALSGILLPFPLDEMRNGEFCKRIASYIMKVLAVQDTWRKTAGRAALNTLARHGNQIQTFLVSEFHEWHQILQNWLILGVEERKVAKQALLTFYSVMAQHSSMQGNKDVLQFFSAHFKEQFEKSQDVDIAVKGFGLFAKAIKLQTPEEISRIFNILAQRSQEESVKGNHHKTADFLDSLSVLSVELGVIHSLQLTILEALSVQLISQFANEEHPSWQNVMVDAVIFTILRLYNSSGSALDVYLNTIVHQGIIRTVSHPVVQDAELLIEAGQKKVTTYENYMQFWLNVISLNLSGRGMYCGGTNLSEKRVISRKILDKILTSILDIIDRLDLNLNENLQSEESFESNMEKCIEATNPQDFTVLINLTDFTITLLNSLPDQSSLLKWISRLIQHNIRLSTKRPLVSSFYKLLSNIMLIAQKLGFFDDQKDEMEDVEWRPTVKLLSGFLYDVITRQSQYRGDLQVACLRLMLATPSCIATPLLRICVTAFQSVFRIGCSMLPLAQEGLQTLSRWNQDISEDKMTLLLKAVLPLLDSLLQTRDNILDVDDESSVHGMNIVKKMLQDRKKKRLWKPKVHLHEDTDLAQLQKEVVLFLSTLNSNSYLSLLDGSEERVGVTSWQKEKLLSFILPFPDMKVEISLDDILPRLADLATNCSDRQTRTVACELLQAVVMFMLGKEKQLETAHIGRLTPLWNRIFPKILCLACDMDLVVVQLFEPLGLQLAHWYSSKAHENSEQSEAFLQALLDGITHQTDAALRDYSASCLHEYVEWSRRQGHMLEKVQPVIKFVTDLCKHPCPQKRMGAALAFNSMYTVLREDLSIVDGFWLELMHGLVTGLSMCSISGEDSHTEIQLEKSLRHILRVLMQYSNKFNMDRDCRRIPKEFGGNTLWHVVRWLLNYCTALNSKCRHTCMDMVDHLAKKVTNCCSTKDFILKVIEVEGTNSLLVIAEGRRGLPITLPKSAPWDQALNWVHSLLASMESYIWLLRINTPPEILLTISNSNILKALLHFVDGVAQFPVDQQSLWRPKAMENFNLVKCCAIVRMIEYMTIVLDSNHGEILDSLWASNFLLTIVYCSVWPSHVGFDSTSKSVEENLPITTERFLKAFVHNAPAYAVNELKDLLKCHISKSASELLNRFSVAMKNDMVTSKDKDLVKGLKVLQAVFEDTHVWSALVGNTSLEIVFHSIVEEVLNSDQNAPVFLGPHALLYATSMLELFFAISPEVKSVIQFTLDGTPLTPRGLEGTLTHGEHFVACFKVVLANRLLETPKESIEVLERLLTPEVRPCHLSILPSLLKSNYPPDSANWSHLRKLILCLLSKWNGFKRWAQGDCGKEMWLSSLLTLTVKLQTDFQSLSDYQAICSWICEILIDPSRKLTFKTDLLLCLPIVFSSQGFQSCDMRKVLQDFKDQHFPLQSSEFKKGTEEYFNFVRAFEALLQSLVVTGNCIILQYVVKMMAVDSKHVCHHLLPSTLTAYMSRLRDQPNRQLESLKLVFDMFHEETRFIDARVCILNEFLLKLMQEASYPAQEMFAKQIIRELLNVIGVRVNMRSGSDIMIRQKLVSQIGCWNLLQQIYGFPVTSFFEGRGSELLHAAFSGTSTVVVKGNELTLELTKKAVEVLKSQLNKSDWTEKVRDTYRVFLCAVFNMLATLICNLKTSPSDLKFYEKFLFDEKTKIIWNDLVDDNKCYMLPYEQTEHLRNVEKVVSIRRKVNEERNEGKIDLQRSLHLLQTQSLFAGSLESDITRFDFTHSRVLNISNEKEAKEDKCTIVLESDALNEHECMATICSIIRHLVDSQISPAPSVGTNLVMPGWINSLKNAMLHEDCSRNSALFILRVILNCEQYFSPYAMHLIVPIFDCIHKFCLTNRISYLLGDVIGLLSKWSALNPSVKLQRSKASRLLHFLVQECHSTVRTVFKYQLELIRSVLDVWKDYVDPPHTLLEGKLKSCDKKLGINLTAIMLFYNLPPWTTESKQHFLNFLMKNLQDDRKEVFKASAETLGLSLNYLNKIGDGHLTPVDESFVSQLIMYLKVVHSKQRDCDRFLTIISGVHESYPDIVDALETTILFYLGQTKDEKKAQCLNLLSNRLFGDNAYQDLYNRGLLNMLSDRNSDVQIKALQILSQLAPSLSELNMLEVMRKLSETSCLVKGEARILVHQISLFAFDQFSKCSSDVEKQVYDESRALLLMGLVSPNLELQKKSYSEWSKEERLPSDAPQRITTIFSLMYSPQTEQYFLRYGVPLMLDGTACTPDFESTVFQHGLEHCTFQDRIMMNSWRVKNAPMAPMFAQTFTNHISRPDSMNASLGDSSFQLLATQTSLMFQPTMDSTDESDSSNLTMKDKSNLARSSFLFSQGSGMNSSRNSMRKTYKQGDGFGEHHLRPNDESGSEDQHKNARSTSRFNRYLSKHAAVRVHSMANVRKAKRRKEMWEERARKREGQVNIHRKYRQGDFPDIQINYSEFIIPLKELSKRDNIIARKVLVNMFIGVKRFLDSSMQSDDFELQTAGLLNNVLQQSESYESPTIGACLEIAYHCKLRLHPDLVSEASQNSDLLALGVLLLETIVHETEDSEKNWLLLAELYDCLGERDLAHATLLQNVSLGDKSKAALEAHAEEQWHVAKKRYFDALVETKYDNFYESCFECMTILSEWGQINQVIREEVDKDLDNLWAVSWYEKKLLPRLLHSELLNIVQKNKDEHQFMNVMNCWLKDDAKGPILKDRFSENLAILCLCKQKFPLSRCFGSKTLAKFVDDWIELNPLFRRRREIALTNVLSIAEVMGFFSGGKEIQSDEECIAFLKRIEKVFPVPQDSLMLWETRVHYRMACMECMPQTMKDQVSETSLKMQLSLIEAALHQGNQDFAKKYSSIIKSKVEASNPVIKTRWLLAKCWERHQWAEREKNPAKRLENLVQIWMHLDQVVASDDLDAHPDLSVTAHTAESKMSFSIKCLLFNDPAVATTLQTRSKITYDWLLRKLQLDLTNTSSEIIAGLESIGLTSLIHSKNIAKECHNDSQINGMQTAEAYWQIAQYCHKVLGSEGNVPSSGVAHTFTNSLVRATLSAMKNGSNQARQLFPLLLQIPTLSSEHSKDFKEKAAVVPAWMFLKWIPQILALLDTPAAHVVGPLLLKIAEKYPNAVSYPYNISRKNYHLDHPSTKKVIGRLDSLLESNSLQIQLVRALSCLSFPSVILKYHIDKLSTAIQAVSVDWQSIKEICNTVIEEVLGGTCESTIQPRFIGNFFESIQEQGIRGLFDKLCEAVHAKSTTASSAILKEIMKKMEKVAESDGKNIKDFSKLKNFSPWLADFSASKLNVNIEIPGQYSGDQKPVPERHVMIARFEGNVQVMKSIRRPVKLTIIGSDAISQNFLVKFGEDLRQDERVQQLLGLMNGIFMNDYRCRERQLSVYTYKVIPLSSRLGMIEWVDGTSSLRELMFSSVTNEEIDCIQGVVAEYLNWLFQCTRSEVYKIVYGKAHQSISKSKATEKFSKILARINPNILRNGLTMWSSSAEAFYWLRQSFITSYSTLCIAHWLLGVGDRHLNNCLVSQKSGQCIGIDFGHVFGSATQFLPVQELVPFRLTPGIVNIVQPHGTRREHSGLGLIEETMVNALRALQANPDVLLATMQVFIQEPSIDWLLLARKHFSSNEDNSTWLPAMKVQQARRKLKGVNPVVIVKEDVESSPHKDFTSAYCRTLMGNPQNVRAKLGEDSLTARQQVECLIDLATDYDVLSKTFRGWEPWM